MFVCVLVCDKRKDGEQGKHVFVCLCLRVFVCDGKDGEQGNNVIISERAIATACDIRVVSVISSDGEQDQKCVFVRSCVRVFVCSCTAKNA